MTTATPHVRGEHADARMHAVLRDLAVDAEPEAVARVRQFVRDTCREWGLEESSDAAVLMASELATNAVRYARTPLHVWLARRPDRLVVSVEDASTEPAQRRRVTDVDEGGRGLQVVEALAVSWGEKDRRRGTVVWAELMTQEISVR